MAPDITRQVFTVHKHRPAAHGITGNNIFAGGFFHKTLWCDHRNMALINFLLRNNPQCATKVIKMRMSEEYRADAG